jgi:hypothetical protein
LIPYGLPVKFPDNARMNRPTIICLTPVKNEAWILERFLKAFLHY